MIAAVCVTTAARAWCLPLAVEMFLRQTYTGPRVMVVFSDGELVPAAACPASPRVRHVHWSGSAGPLGQKRNLAVQAAASMGATSIAVWDDDDYHGPDRLSWLAAQLEKYQIVGAQHLDFAELEGGERWRYTYRGSRPYVVGGSSAFRVSAWRAVGGYPQVARAEDTQFSWRLCSAVGPAEVCVLPEWLREIYIPLRHGANTGKVRHQEPQWARVDAPWSPAVAEWLARARLAHSRHRLAQGGTLG